MTASDALTVIRARGRRLAKLIRANGKIEGYDDAKHFDLFDVPVPNLDALAGLLCRLLNRADCAVVRGAIADSERIRRVRRLLHPDDMTGEQPTLREVSHRWLALDMEGIERSERLPASDLPGCAARAVQRLPIAFARARCIVQASASHGIKPGCRLRLWYWLARPTTGAELTYWLRGRPADPAVFRTVQPIYTASPIFESGRDHLPHRVAELAGEPEVSVPSHETLKPPPRSAAPLPIPNAAGSRRYALAALANAAARIQGAAEGQRHHTVLREARSLARLAGAGLLTSYDISETLRTAATNAGIPEAEADSIVAWAIDHPLRGAVLEGAGA